MSERESALTGAVAALQTANGVDPYHHDLSGQGTVSLSVDTIETRLHLGRVSLRVRDGGETRTQREIGTRMEDATLEILVSALVRDDSADGLVTQMQDLIEDVTRAIGTNPTLGGAVTFARIAIVEPPSYDVDEMKHAHTVIRLLAEYRFDAGPWLA